MKLVAQTMAEEAESAKKSALEEGEVVESEPDLEEGEIVDLDNDSKNSRSLTNLYDQCDRYYLTGSAKLDSSDL